MIGRSIAHYHITAAIGSGGMGEVFRAADTRLGRAVALKVLPAEMARDPERLARFQREARAVAALNHPNIVTIYSVEESDGIHFLTMELVEGVSLADLIPEGGLPLDQMISIGTALADALAAAHEKGIVHRDLKPANVMMTTDGLLKVLDFGLAKDVRADTAADEALTMAGHTKEGVVMGTPSYMSPEQITGRTVDHRTDIFSLGIVLYQMASGQRPFEGSTSIELASAILRDTPRPLGEIRSGVPADFARLIRRCLEKDPQRRVQTPRDVSNELREIARSATQDTGAGPARSGTSSRLTATHADEGFRVAVLPFKYSGGNADLAALAEGLSEEIITGLSRFSYLRVIARGSTSAGARYVMEGSIRHAGSTVRLAVQLMDATSGAHLWAETYDRLFQPDQIFAMQDELIPRIVSTCADRFGVLARSISDAVRGKESGQLSPYEALMRGFGYHHRLNPVDHAEARDALERAVAQAPGNADCWAMLSWIYSHEYGHGFNPRPGSLDRSLAAARRAVEAAPSNQVAHQALAVALFFRKDVAGCLSAAERAMALNPLDGSNEAIFLITFTGDWERGCALIARAMELNPHHPGWYRVVLATNEYRKANYRAAVDEVVKANVPGIFWTKVLLVAAQSQLGELEAAREALPGLLAEKEDLIHAAREMFGKWLAPELVEHLIEGLRKAGLEIDASTANQASARADEGFRVAVLPFKYTGSNSDLTALAEGMSEEIVTGLSRFSYLRVIARGSTVRYVNQAVDARAVGAEIGARYVMDGSVRQAGSQLRVAAQLVDASTGAHLWAETYARPCSGKDVFALQDDLVPRIVSTVADMNGVLPRSMSEVLRSRNPDQLSPYEAVLRSFGYLERVTPEDLAAARSGLEWAVRKAPAHADAWAMLSLLSVQEYGQGFNLQPDSLMSGLAAARRAVEVAPSNALAHFSLAQALFFHKEFQSFRNAAERAVALNPMDGNSIAFLGELLTYAGDRERGLELAGRAKQLNPNHPGWYWYADFYDAYHQGDYRGALGFLVKANLPGHWGSRAGMAAVCGQLGERDAAGKALRSLLQLRPDFAATARESFEKWWEPEYVEHMIDGLRKAGLEIHTAQTSAGTTPAVETAGRKTSTTQSIAVLPFANMSADKDQNYFSDGLAEEIINLLAHVSGLKVIARTSAFAFRGKEQDIRGIGEALGVRTILQGSVRRAGSRIRVTAQLINAADGDHLWSERFDREMTEVFAVQDEIAAAIGTALKVTLTGKAVDARYHEPNLPAYEAFLKGRHHYYQFSPEAFARAEQEFTQATALDPQWAEPRAALGDLYFSLGFYGWRPLDDMIPHARAEARKALDLLPSHPLAHAVLGTVAALHDYDSKEAARQFSSARASESLGPNGRLNALFYSHVLFYSMARGRFDEALQEMATVITEDPVNSFWRARRAWVYVWADRHDEAIAEAGKALEFDDTNYQARMMIALAHATLGNLPEAREHAEETFRLAPFDSFCRGLLAGLLGNAGDTARAEQLIASMTGAVPIGMTIYHLVRGDIDPALDWYQKDVELRSPNAPMIAFAGFLRPLRASPRWSKVARLMNLP